MSDARRPWLVAGAVLLVAALAVSGARPYDRATWLLEVVPMLVVLPLSWATYGRFR